MKIKRRILSLLTALMLFVNVPLLGFTTVYADTIASQNPLFIPISTLVATVAVGSGIIAKNSSEALQAGNQLVNNVIQNIKNNAIARREADPTYTDDWKVINGQGEPEEPNDNNKNGKWVGLAGGTIASGEIWANKEMIADIMRGVYDVKGYQEYTTTSGIVEKNDFVNQGSASQIALQLAKISNSSVTQFDTFLHSSYWDDKEYSPDDCIFWVNTRLIDIFTSTPKYPTLYIAYIVNNENFSKVNLLQNPFAVGTFSNNYGSYSGYYCKNHNDAFRTLNSDNVAYNPIYCRIKINSRNSNTEFSYGQTFSVQDRNNFRVNGYDSSTGTWYDGVNYAYSGYKWTIQSPFQYTNNVYNVEQTFDVNFPDWLQDSINLLNQNINAVRLGIQSLNDPWNNTQTEVQTGTSPTNVINQYINNYYNPENIPEDNPNTGGDDEPSEEPETEAEPATEEMVDVASQNLWDWAMSKITLPDGIWEKIPFSIPYDCYLLIKSVLPSRGGGTRKKMLKATYNAPSVPDGITISSYYDASGADVRSNQAVFTVPSKWSDNAPVINWDLHFKYTDTNGQKQTLDYVKTVDLSDYAYFAMIIYIGLYVLWMGTILGFIFDSFK